MFKKILVAIDGSEISKKVIETASVVGKENGAEVILLHVGEEINLYLYPYARGQLLSAQYNQEYNETVRKQAEELLQIAKEKIQANGINASDVYACGNPAQTIIEYTKENSIDLIIIGNRGLGPFKEMMLGSVSHKVSQLASCPVLIVK